MTSAKPPKYFFPGINFNDAFFITTSNGTTSGVSQTYVDNTFLKKSGDTASGLINLSAGANIDSTLNLDLTPFISWNPTSQSYIINDSGALTLTTGINNTVFGHTCGDAIDTGSYNTLYGFNAGTHINSGNSNTCYGRGAGRNLDVQSDNTFIGHQAGINATSTKSTLLGSATECNGFSACSVIGYGATATADNQIVLGTTSENTIVSGGLTVGKSVSISDYLTVNKTITTSTTNAPTSGQLGYSFLLGVTWTTALNTTLKNIATFTINGSSIPFGVYNIVVHLVAVDTGAGGNYAFSLSTTSTVFQAPMSYANAYPVTPGNQFYVDINTTLSVFSSTTYYIVSLCNVGTSGTLNTTGANTSQIRLTRIA